MTDSELLHEACWAVDWLMGLIDDDRIDDLVEDDEYVMRARALHDAFSVRLERFGGKQ